MVVLWTRNLRIVTVVNNQQWSMVIGVITCIRKVYVGDSAMFTFVDSLYQFGFPLHIYVLPSPDYYEKGHSEVTVYGKQLVELLIGKLIIRKK